MKYSHFVLFVISLALATSAFFGFLPHAHAQFNQLTQSQVNVLMIPENPGPNQVVNVSLTSYDTNIDEATITWKVDGTTKKTGKGQKNFQFTTGSMNTTTTLGVTITTGLGETVTKTIRIQPVSVDLVWQSDSFVPPFYRGKPMFSYQNKITFIAIPHIIASNGGEVSAKNLIYKWSVNGSVVDDASGYGKNTYSTTGSLIARPLDVSVDVSGTSGVGVARILVAPKDPSVIFYKKNPLYGIEFQKALQGTEGLVNSQEVTVVGMPYFFGTTDSASPYLSYRWAINGKSITTNYNSNLQVFRQKEGTSGESAISLGIENTGKMLQSASSQFNLKFENNTPTDTTL